MLLNRRFLQFIFICWFCLTSIFVQKVFGQTNAQELKIVQLSDIHYDSILINIGSRMYGESRELFQAAINDINSLKNLDAIVSSGDNINRPSKKDLFNFLKTSKQLKIPFYITIGNHDVGLLGNSSKRFYINTLKKYYPYIKPEGKNTYYITDNIKGYKFIFLDGVIDGQISAHGLFPKEQLAWLDNKLKANENYKIIIVQHHPVVPPFEGGTHDVINSDEYLEIIDKHNNVVAVLSGHYHCVKAIIRNNVLHASAPSLVQYPNAYRLMTFKDEDNCTLITSEFRETALKDVQNTSKERIFRNLDIYSGEKEDQIFTYKLCK